MSKIIKFNDADLGAIYFEVAENDKLPKSGLTSMADDDAEGKFDQALGTIKGIARKLVAHIVDIPERPDEVECKIGIKFNVEAGIIIAKTSTEGNLEITLKWKKDNQQPS